jgi:hypothetical protein
MADQPNTTATRAKAVQNPWQITTLPATREALLRRLWAEHDGEGRPVHG